MAGDGAGTQRPETRAPFQCQVGKSMGFGSWNWWNWWNWLVNVGYLKNYI